MPKNTEILHLAEHLNKTISLADFVEQELGCRLKWTKGKQSALLNCPFHDHNDSNASCRINLLDEDIWVLHCFGCGRSATLVSFCKTYYDLPDRESAILWLCKKYNIKNTEDIILNSIKNLSKKMDSQRKAENLNIVVSNRCRYLLRQNLKDNKDFVFDCYRKLNMAMDEADLVKIEEIDNEVQKRLNRG